jgi:predicted transcriptional regulator
MKATKAAHKEAKWFHTLGNHVSLAIIRGLASGDKTTAVLAKLLGADPTRVRFLVKHLEAIGIVESEKTGIVYRYRLMASVRVGEQNIELTVPGGTKVVLPQELVKD